MLNNATCRCNSRQLPDDFLVGLFIQDVMREAKIDISGEILLLIQWM